MHSSIVNLAQRFWGVAKGHYINILNNNNNNNQVFVDAVVCVVVFLV